MEETVAVPLAAAITVLAVLAVIGVVKATLSVWPWAKRAVHFMDRLDAIETAVDAAKQSSSAAAEAAHRAADAAEAAKREVLVDSGTSLRDVVDRLETAQGEILERLTALESKVS